jgi:hypothetical protein
MLNNGVLKTAFYHPSPTTLIHDLPMISNQNAWVYYFSTRVKEAWKTIMSARFYMLAHRWVWQFTYLPSKFSINWLSFA